MRQQLRYCIWLLCAYCPLGLGANAQLALVIDDIGYQAQLGRQAIDLPGAITFAVLPFTPHGAELANYAYRQGKQILLHAPMSNKRQLPLGPGGLTSAMTQAQLLTTLRQNIANIPHLIGVNNHMGSQLTENAQAMHWVMAELQTQGLFFIDSRTSSDSQALAAAQAIQLPSRKRDVFLDDERTIAAISQQLNRAIALAKKHGSALAIGHPYRETITVLQQLPNILQGTDVQLVFASQLLTPALSSRVKHSAISHCAAPPMYLWTKPRTPIDPFELSRWP
jgi:polysaccharide deacetylase 2 family uncharacterized protein YibQ